MTTADADHLLRILGELDRFLVESLDPILKDMGIGREHWHVLRLLEDGRGRPMGELSRLAGLANATATRVVDALTANMLVHRRTDPFDRRRVLVYLAEPGEECLRRITEAMKHHAGLVLGRPDAPGPGDLFHLLDRVARLWASASVPDRADRRAYADGPGPAPGEHTAQGEEAVS